MDPEAALREEAQRQAGSVGVAGVLERIGNRVARKRRLRKVQAAALAIGVVSGVAGGLYGLSIVFQSSPNSGSVPGASVATPPGRVSTGPPAALNGRLALVAILDEEGVEEGIFTMASDGMAAEPIRTNSSYYSRWISWSSDGSKMIFPRGFHEGRSEFVIIGADGRVEGEVADVGRLVDAGSARWSPDGRRLVFTTGDGNIHVMSTDNSMPRQVTDSGGPCHDGDPAWSPDGERIAFNHTCIRPGLRSGIYTVDPDGPSQQRLITAFGPDRPTFGLDWSPDGSKMAFGGSGGAIYTMNADGTQLMKATHGELDAYPAWSPDGMYLAFLRERDGHSQIWVMDAGGGEPWELAGAAHLFVVAFDWIP